MTAVDRRGARRRLPVLALMAAAVAVGLLAFLGEEPADEVVETLGSVGPIPDLPAVVTEPTLPTEIDSPWCVALLALDRPDGPTGVGLAAAYRTIASTAPPGLAADLIGAADRIDGTVDTIAEDTGEDNGEDAAEVASGEPSGTATLPDDFDAEGRSVEDDPVLRVAEYVEAVCRATGANPGPPPTQPVVAADPSTAPP